MAKFTSNKINSIFLRAPDLRYMIGRSFRKLTGVCPFEIVKGVTNATEAGYVPSNSRPSDYTTFEQVLDGNSPVMVDWEDSVDFPFDGDLDNRYNKGIKVRTENKAGVFSLESAKVSALGSVFMYENNKEFK